MSFCAIRRTKREQLAGLTDYVCARKVAHNTIARTLADGTVIIRLHLTDLITIYPNGTIKIDTEGYQTTTSKERINRYIGPVWSVYQEKHVWWLYRRADGTRHRYVDGTKLLADGTIVQPLFYAEDECPNCHNGTLEKNEAGEIVCRGECGAIVG